MFAILIMPILDGIASLILTLFEILKSNMIRRNQTAQDQTDVAQRPIGFITPTEEEGNTDDDI